MDSVATGSLVNAVGGRKRKRKDGDAQSATGSMRGGKARSATTGVEGEGNGQEEQNEEEDDDIEEMDAVLEGGKSTEATRKQEAEHLRYVVLLFPCACNFKRNGNKRILTQHRAVSS